VPTVPPFASQKAFEVTQSAPTAVGTQAKAWFASARTIVISHVPVCSTDASSGQ